MTTGCTREEVERAVEDCSGPLHVVHSQGIDTVRRHAITLAAEVRALREEIRFLQKMREGLGAALSVLSVADGAWVAVRDRLEALCVEWEEPHLGDFLPREAAVRLRAALRGEL